MMPWPGDPRALLPSQVLALLFCRRGWRWVHVRWLDDVRLHRHKQTHVQVEAQKASLTRCCQDKPLHMLPAVLPALMH